MLSHFGWRAAAAIVLSTAVYYLAFRARVRGTGVPTRGGDAERPDEDAGAGCSRCPMGDAGAPRVSHLDVVNAHYPALFLGGFMFFLAFAKATAMYQSRQELRTPLLVGFFLAGLVIHGGLQGWWMGPVLRSLSSDALFWGATLLTAFNDNALITYLATLVPNLGEPFKAAVVAGAVTGGGLTVIANAPNPAGQAILSRFFDDSVSPLKLAAGALIPTLVAAAVFRLL
jgi:hypothetical protein